MKQEESNTIEETGIAALPLDTSAVCQKGRDKVDKNIFTLCTKSRVLLDPFFNGYGTG
jgi:hypothetical protein